VVRITVQWALVLVLVASFTAVQVLVIAELVLVQSLVVLAAVQLVAVALVADAAIAVTLVLRAADAAEV